MFLVGRQIAGRCDRHAGRAGLGFFRLPHVALQETIRAGVDGSADDERMNRRGRLGRCGGPGLSDAGNRNDPAGRRRSVTR